MLGVPWSRPLAACAVCAIWIVSLSGCGGGGGDISGDQVVPHSIGGQVGGLTGSGLELQLNGGSVLAISANGPFTFGAQVNDGIAYAVTVRTQPTNPAQYCLVGRGTGVVRGSDVSDIVVTCSAVQAVYPTNGGNWNQWVLNDGPNANPLRASDRACTVDAGRAAMPGCVHAGELRRWDSQRAVACTGLVVSDALDAFEWICTQSPSGSAVFTSTGLKPGRKLSDLIDFNAAAWRANHIRVTGAQTFDSPSGVWWSNPLQLFNAGGVTTPNAIHLITADVQAQVSLRDGAAVVVQPGRTLRRAAGTSAVVVGTIVGIGTWFEGEIDAAEADNGIYLQGFVATVLRGVRVANANGTGIEAGASDSLLLDDVHAVNNGAAGLSLGNAFQLRNCSATHNGGVGVVLRRRSVAERVTVAHNGSQGMMVNGIDSVVTSVTAVDNASTGVWISGQFNLARSVVAVNNGWVGIELDRFNTLADSAASNNRFEGLRVFGVDNRITGTIRLGVTADCGGLIAGCINIGSSDASFVLGAGIPEAFAGKVTADDAANASDSAGTAATATVSDWLHFANEMRGWGPDGAAFPDPLQRGLCVAGSACRIWDWSLHASDTVLLDRFALPTGDDIIAHRWSVSDAAACATIPGAAWNVVLFTCTSTALRWAVERPSRGGNGNTLCERGESCLALPNFGAYQGHGALAAVGPPASTGQIAAVSLWQHTTNGR